jgi:hypothetical protein
MKLTGLQREVIRRLRKATSIHYGVKWYYTYPSTDGKQERMNWLNGTVCNALVRKGILVSVEGSLTEYTLHMDGVEL